jgi:Gpi18-like mannosyltransferase
MIHEQFCYATRNLVQQHYPAIATFLAVLICSAVIYLSARWFAADGMLVTGPGVRSPAC